MTENYKNPPIDEAICELHFIPEPKWDWTVPGLFYSEIKDEFYDKKEIRGMGIEFQLNTKDPLLRKYTDSVDRIQFWSEDKSKVIQIGENRLIINRRHPYIGWNDFKSIIKPTIKRYSNLTKQNIIQSFNLRYINKIDDLPNKFRIQDYFKYYPNYPENLETVTGPLQMLGHFPITTLENFAGIMKLAFFIKHEENSFPCFLDINLSFSNTQIEISNFDEVLEKAHLSIVETFEACITNKLRETFR